MSVQHRDQETSTIQYLENTQISAVMVEVSRLRSNELETYKETQEKI